MVIPTNWEIFLYAPVTAKDCPYTVRIGGQVGSGHLHHERKCRSARLFVRPSISIGRFSPALLSMDPRSHVRCFRIDIIKIASVLRGFLVLRELGIMTYDLCPVERGIVRILSGYVPCAPLRCGIQPFDTWSTCSGSRTSNKLAWRNSPVGKRSNDRLSMLQARTF